MLTNSLNSLLAYINHFEIADYMAFIWFLILSFLFLILGILLLRRYTLTGLFIVFVVLVIICIGPFVIKYYLNSSIRKSEANITDTKQLAFSDTFILQGNVKNLSKKIFSTCRVYIGFYKHSKSSLKQFANDLKPYKKRIHIMKKPLDINKSVDFRIVFENFRLPKDINITAISECYK